MIFDTLPGETRHWQTALKRLGGAETLEIRVRDATAFRRARGIESAADLQRVILAYCLGGRGLRSTAAWAASIGLVDISNVALLYRLRQCGDWLAVLVGQALVSAAPKASRGRMIRIIDATTVLKAGTATKLQNKLWRIRSAFDFQSERFGFFELTDQQGGETLDRMPVVKGEIRIADRAYLQASPSSRFPYLPLGGQRSELGARRSHGGRPFCFSSRSSANARTLPAWLPPRDPARCVAPAAPARRHAYLSHHPTANHRLPRAMQSPAPTTSPQAAATTQLPKNAPLILAPMGSQSGGRAGLAGPAGLSQQVAHELAE